MELIRKSDALHAVLHNQGDAAVAAVQAIKPINPHGELREMLIDEMIDKGEWIKCSERLPEHGVHVLVACLVKMFDGVGRYYVCDAFHTEHFTDTCNYDDDIDMEYNEEEDEYYMPPGWWEVIKNWDDYTCVAIEDHVTHWMPLPDTPEVEG